jgi:dipeptidyl aminopeptidase/acylaminoacyl peptidase
MPYRRRSHLNASERLACGAATLATLALLAATPAFAQHSNAVAKEHFPSCPAPSAGQHLPTVADVMQLRGEKLGRTNPFGAYDISPDGNRVAVQIRRPVADARAHATSSFFWLHADVAVYDTRTSHRLGLLDNAEHGDSWAAPFWSPDGHQLAVTHIGPESLDRQMYVWDGADAPARRIVPGALAASLRLARGTPNGRAGAYVWIAPDTLLVATIPDGTGTLDKDDAMMQWPREWAASGRGAHIEPAVSDAHLPASIPRVHPLGDSLTLWRVNTRTGARHAIVTVQALRGRYPRNILVSRDNRMVAFTPDVRPIDASRGVPKLNRAETELLLIDLRTGRIMQPLPGRHALVTRWSADDSTVSVQLAGDTVVQVRRDGTVVRGTPPQLAATPSARTAGNSASRRDTAPVVETRVDGSGEQLIIRRGHDERVIVALDSAISKLAVCRAQYFRYATGSGDTVYARVTVPPGFDGSRRYPVLAQMYPGTVHTAGEARTDTGAYVPQSTVWDPAVFAAHGYVVLEASVPLHGGGADHAPQFSGDILPAIDSLIAWGVADPDRLGIDGISFGGYGTAMVLAQTHRFKAAVTRNGLYDLVSMYGLFSPPSRMSDDAGERLWAPGWAEDGQGHLGVPPYDHWEMYGKASPITHVDSITTPVLIISGDMDYAAPMEQSEEFFTALNRKGKAVRYVRYPGEAHGNASAADLEDQFRQMTNWFDAWFAHGEHR